MTTESYFDLLTNLPHWLFELTLIAIFDGLIGLVVWPRIKRHIHKDVRHAEHHAHGETFISEADLWADEPHGDE